MIWGLVLSIILGFAGVLQASVNRRIADDWGFFGAALINNLVLFVFSIGVVVLACSYGDWFSLMRQRPFVWHWWYIVPGICGFLFVIGLPFAFSRAGALSAMMVLIAAQLLASVFWDYWIDGAEVSLVRLLGVAIVMSGAAIAIMN